MNAQVQLYRDVTIRFLRTHAVRIAAGAFIAAGVGTAANTQSLLGLLAICPALIAALVPLVSHPALTAAIDGWSAWFERVRARGAAGDGRFSRWFLYPLGAGSLGLWRVTERVREPNTRAGIRVSAMIYFWALMLTLLASVLYLLLALLILAVGFTVVSWFMNQGSSNEPRWSDDEEPNWRERLSGTRIMQRGLVPDAPTGTAIDGDGRVVQEGLFTNTPTGLKVTDDGRIVREGWFADTPTGKRLNERGQLVEEGWIFDTPTGTRIDNSGEIVSEGLFFDEKTGRYFRKDS